MVTRQSPSANRSQKAFFSDSMTISERQFSLQTENVSRFSQFKNFH